MRKSRKEVAVEALESRRLISGVPMPAHVVMVIEENHSFDEIIGNSQATYINSLASNGALFTSSFAVDHPSQPNYLAIFSGSEQGITDDNPTPTFNAPNLASELIAAGKTFGGYSEDLPSVGSTVITSGAYARKHNPWSDFSNVPSSDNMPFTSFPSDYTKLPTVSIVVPNLNDDMHDGTIQEGDQWLQANMGSFATWAQTHNSLLIVTWDEDDGSGPNQIPTIFYGANINAGSYGETINHYNVLRTIEDMYNLPDAANSAGATPITDVWQSIGLSNTISGAGNDQISLVQDGDNQHIDWTLGATTGQVAITDATGLTINDSSGNNELILNYGNGDPLPNRLTLNGTFTIDGLQGGNPLAGTTLNINRSTVYIDYAGSSDPIAAIRGYLKNGYNGGAWNGAATASTGVITSSAAASNSLQNTAIGYIDSADGTGLNPTPTSIKLEYTFYGDTTLAGTVGFNDFTRLTQHYGQSGASWDSGDFNYDGSVNFNDFTLMSRAYGTSGSQATAAVNAADPATASQRRLRHHQG